MTLTVAAAGLVVASVVVVAACTVALVRDVRRARLRPERVASLEALGRRVEEE